MSPSPGCGGEGQNRVHAQERRRTANCIGLYLELEGSGVIVKLKGTVSANPARAS